MKFDFLHYIFGLMFYENYNKYNIYLITYFGEYKWSVAFERTYLQCLTQLICLNWCSCRIWMISIIIFFMFVYSIMNTWIPALNVSIFLAIISNLWLLNQRMNDLHCFEINSHCSIRYCDFLTTGIRIPVIYLRDNIDYQWM